MVPTGTTQAISDWLPALLAYPRGEISLDKGQYQSLTPPISIIRGDMDTVTPPTQGQVLAMLIPNARLTIMNGVGHIPQIEVPTVFQEILIDVLKAMEIQNERGQTAPL